MEDKDYNAADPKQVKEQRRDLRFDDRIAQEDLKALLKDAAFRRFVWKYMGHCRFMQLSFAGENHAQTAFNEGMRAVGNQLFDDIRRANPKAFVEMMAEAEKKLEARKEKESGRRDDEDRS